MEVSNIENNSESPYFPGTPDGTPPAIQIERALEEKENNEEFIPRTPEGTPPDVQIQRAMEKTEQDSLKKNPKKDLETMVELYLADNPSVYDSKRTCELEVRFGTNPKNGKPLSKIDYDNVVEHFYSAGYSSENIEGLSILRIQNEDFLDKKTGQIKMSNIRAEVMGIDLIQEYCRTNNLQKVLDLPSTISAVSDKIKFTKKHPPYIGATRETSKPLKSVDFSDFNFRVSYQHEKDFYSHSEIAKRILSNWLDTRKTFRYINRVRLSHPEYPVFLDVSIIKSSPTKRSNNRKVPIPVYTIQEANVFQNSKEYEVELEIDNKRIGPGTDYDTPKKVVDVLRKCIRLVLGGLQGTNYPIGNNEKEKTLQSYLELVFGKEYHDEYMKDYLNTNSNIQRSAMRKLTKHFTGPSSFTLQMENITPLTKDKENISNVPNIRENYTVTDKADGERNLLYVSSIGHMYLIDTNMNFMFTGVVTQNKDLFDSLLDGEHIKYDKNNKFINLYAAFDIYFINKKSVRELNFMPMELDDVPEKFRLNLLNNFIKELNPKSILSKDSGNSNPVKMHGDVNDNKEHSCWLTITCKQFYSSFEDNIFNGCSKILTKVKDGLFEYNTDGLIFTPASTGVGGDRSQHAGPVKKFTWERSFKWKPPEFNTIDFLVSIKKDKNGKDEIHNIFQEGISLNNSDNILQYKTLELRCGYSRKDHGYLNPMLDMINDEIPSQENRDNFQKYEPVKFQPTNPYDPQAYYCNVELHNNGTTLVMLTKENEYFDEDMIVEFSYDLSKKGYWRWIPLRVRYDKTNDLKNGGTNFGNAYHVANSNWHSIHNPITNDMISSGEDIPDIILDEDVYYNESDKDTNTKALRNFHNLYVKRHLIMGVSNQGDTLIDYAVGKGGDFPKWIASKLKFVFGIDVSKDNIENKKNGACARYLNNRMKFKHMPGALFAHGNSSMNIRNGKALVSERDKQIAAAVFGNGSKDKEELGDGVYKYFGIGQEGFNISSCQFALHYFFESEKTLHSYLRNLSECTMLNGYFIATCYDGQSVFNLLKSKNKGESMSIYQDDNKIYELIKQYNHTGFPEDEYSLKYGIDVYQESINKTAREYLVNFKYFQRVMENYGFTIITDEEASSMGFPSGTGLFSELFQNMMSEIDQNSKKKKDYEDAPNMTSGEKQISFMNRYCVFRKTHNVNAEKVYKLLVTRDKVDEVNEDQLIDSIHKEDAELEKTKKENIKKTVIIRKLPGKKRKIVISENKEKGENTELTMTKPKTVIIKKKKSK